ncbi:MAG: hypothetical protein MUF71_01410 [Candidatus Kapabacteria bacterium]|jgi:hypothetical protein|nr:hypothetical protein [Candidatus Kapabacteria bacterium]
MIQVELRQELQDYTQSVRLWRRQWIDKSVELPPLKWERVRFNEDSKVSVPDTPGLYAFFIEPELANFPNHAYLMYIGKAGDKSKNTLRKRFMQYFQDKKRFDAARPKINKLLNNWDGYLYFYFHEITDPSTDIAKLEKLLLDTFLPSCNKNGFSVWISTILNAL